MSALTSINPATGEVIKIYAPYSPAHVADSISRAHNAFLDWRRRPMEERGKFLLKIAETLLSGKEAYGRLISEEMGKPLKEAVTEVEKCAACARYMAENGPRFLADHPIATEYKKSYVTFQPIGPIFAIMPWNFPFWQVFRFALPALMAGNVGLLKHAANVTGCALAIEEVFKKAGLPPHVFQTLLLPSDRSEEVIASPLVAAVTLTGSTPAGKSVASLAGKYLKKTVLELGGSDPYLILKDADIAHAIKICSTGRLFNCGQSCISVKRMIVVASVRSQFEQGIVNVFKAQKQGDPFDPATTIGPMARGDLRDGLHKQVTASVKAGARLLLGGEIPAGKGAFYPPTVLTDVRRGTPAYSEEFFGPVGIIIPVKDEEEAIQVANDTVYGLGGGVFTTDLDRGERIARERIDSGACFVNMMVRSDPRMPFGGVKDSGYGRELSAFGIHEFVNIKSIVVA